MVLLAAAVCTKSGKALVSRQFVEMTRARIEGLLAAFPKLLATDKSASASQSQRQHTFVETESVRYVYQPIEQLYMMLMTTKNSNILEDLETLRLFSRIIPEYCRLMEEKDVLEHSFELIFAFDEVVALGYRESVNLAQIRTFTEMDSHEERVFYQIKKTQEEEAKKLARDKAKELAKMKIAKMAGGGGGGRSMGGMGSMGGMSSADAKHMDGVADAFVEKKPQPPKPTRPSGPNRAMKLGAKKADEDQFVQQLQSEGVRVAAAASRVEPVKNGHHAPTPTAKAPVHMESIHMRCEEKLSLVMSRDGGVQSMEVHGLMVLRIQDAGVAQAQIQMRNNDRYGAQIQTHPNLDKKAWQSTSLLTLKNANKPFPINNDIGVLKWRVQSQDESVVPLTINCLPSETSSGCEVNIEYSLEAGENGESLTLNDVVIAIPLPAGAAPVVAECDGDYKHEKGKSLLVWSLPLVDADNSSGTLEFTTASGHSDDFFPVRVNFASTDQFCDIAPVSVKTTDGADVPFSQESTFFADKYEIV